MKRPALRSKILYISSFPPVACGIATYTTDLIRAISGKFNQTFICERCELNDGGQASQSAYSLNPKIKADYVRLAAQVNRDNSINIIHIQHEFGLFGGTNGNYLLEFLSRVNKPILFTFHTVLPNPNEELKKLVQTLAAFASGIFVMTQQSVKILMEEYAINQELLTCIPHGTHLVKWNEKTTIKRSLGFGNRMLLSTFGLLGEGKSIETGLKAMPKIIAQFPNVLYLVIGKTHPNNIRNNKDEYREYLLRLVEELSIEDHVIFIDKYLALPELLKLLQATDIYLFTSKDPNQAVSGTFSYAMSCGCSIIATSIPHTREILNKELGVLVEIEDFQAIANATIKLLFNTSQRERMSINAFQKTRESAWENSAIKHVKIYNKHVYLSGNLTYDYPAVKMDHLKKMTTSRGVIQFSNICIPDITSGYTLDDNARALITFCMHYELYRSEEDLKYIDIYLNFIERCQTKQGNFVNYIDLHDEVHIKNGYVNLEDSNTRALWALGVTISIMDILPIAIQNRALKCFESCRSWLPGIMSPRAIGFTIKGLYFYQKSQPERYIKEEIEALAKNLITQYDLVKEKDWKWFEEYMTYANSILPEAMLYAYLATGKESYKTVALESFDFLLSKMFVDAQFRVISNQGWHQKDVEAKRFGEQPIDVSYTIQSLEIFYKTFGIPTYKIMMEKAFDWFLGENHLQQIIYNPLTGGCNDGLEKENVNLNQGAESTICYLMARLIMERNKNHNVLEEIGRFNGRISRILRTQHIKL
ncbi:glycosyltransferase [Gillisia sp. M10.2A]|uniref:Glycosyltransferase n=1 Tax=Gillisia lutea TaxID=2909668 RepID=A0ABS9EE28_9FLAO|nr:glycosyltransferase [Gillisia lutea]MCF4101123.1 glycosyltransferase [Gillisia lutea]